MRCLGFSIVWTVVHVLVTGFCEFLRWKTRKRSVFRFFCHTIHSMAMKMWKSKMSKWIAKKIERDKKRRRKSTHACTQTRRITSSLVIIILLVKIIRLVSSVSLMKFIFVACKWSCMHIPTEYKGSRTRIFFFNSFGVLYFYCFVGMTSHSSANQHTLQSTMAEVK